MAGLASETRSMSETLLRHDTRFVLGGSTSARRSLVRPNTLPMEELVCPRLYEAASPSQ